MSARPVVTDYATVLTSFRWRTLPGCPGRRIGIDTTDKHPGDLLGRAVPVRVVRVSAAPDPVHVAVFEGGGLISYEKADGRFVHTLNTPEGFARKLAQLGIGLQGG